MPGLFTLALDPKHIKARYDLEYPDAAVKISRHVALLKLQKCSSSVHSKDKSGGDADREKTSDKSSSNNPADTVIDGAKKLKGLLGF